MHFRSPLVRYALLGCFALSLMSTAAALAQKTKSKGGGANRVTELYNAGVKLQNEGKTDEAIAKYTEALAVAPQDFQSLANRGGLYRIKGIEIREAAAAGDDAQKAEAATKAEEQFALSLADYDAAIKASPKSDFLLLGRAAIQMTRGKNDLALVDYDEYVKRKPTEARAYNDRGAAYNEIAKTEKASEKSAEAGLKKATPNFEKAVGDFSKAVEIDPKYVLGYVNRAAVYTQLLKLDEALADFGKVIELDPNYWRAYRGRAEIYRAMADEAKRLGDTPKATQFASMQKENYDKYMEIQARPPAPPAPTPAAPAAPKKK